MARYVAVGMIRWKKNQCINTFGNAQEEPPAIDRAPTIKFKQTEA